MNILGRLRLKWRHAQRRRLRRKLRAQYEAASRIELQWRLYEAERMASAYLKAWLKERDRSTRQLDASRARMDELETLLRTYIAGQALIDSQQINSAAQRARESLASGFGELG